MFGLIAICIGSAVVLTSFFEWRKHVRERDALVIDKNGQLTEPMLALASGVVNEYRQLLLATARVGRSLQLTLVSATCLLASAVAFYLPTRPFDRMHLVNICAVSVVGVMLGAVWYLVALDKADRMQKRYRLQLKS